MALIGQKLDLNDIYNADWQKRFAEPAVLGAMLRECGISFVEFSLGEDTSRELILQTAEVFSGNGVFLSLHPHLYKELSPEIFDDPRKPGIQNILQTAQKTAGITGVPVPLVFHGGRAEWEPYFRPMKEALLSVKSFFRWIDRAVTDSFADVIPLCETQIPWSESDEGMVRLGDTYKSCLDLIHETEIGVCWDFGHTCRASMIGKQGKFPDDHFLSRVKHVHAHDTIQTLSGPEDHYPLDNALAPWKEYCAELARHEYDDTILLEVNPNRYNNIYDFLQGTRDNILKLRDYFPA